MQSAVRQTVKLISRKRFWQSLEGKHPALAQLSSTRIRKRRRRRRLKYLWRKSLENSCFYRVVKRQSQSLVMSDQNFHQNRFELESKRFEMKAIKRKRWASLISLRKRSRPLKIQLFQVDKGQGVQVFLKKSKLQTSNYQSQRLRILLKNHKESIFKANTPQSIKRILTRILWAQS